MTPTFQDEPLNLPDHVLAALRLDAEEAAATALSPGEAMEQTQRADRLAEALRRLPTREQLVLRLHFGLGPFPPQTLAQIGRWIGCSRSWASQVQHAALTRLKRRLRRAGL